LEKADSIPGPRIDEAFSPFVVAKDKGYFEAEVMTLAFWSWRLNEAALQVSAGNAESARRPPAKRSSASSRANSRYRYYYDCTIQHLSSPCCRRVRSSHRRSEGQEVGVQSMAAGHDVSEGLCEEAGLDPAKDISSCRSVLAPSGHLGCQNGHGVIFWDAHCKLAFQA